MTNLKQILSITLPSTIVLILFIPFTSSLFGTVFVLIVIQAIFWKFVKWNF